MRNDKSTVNICLMSSICSAGYDFFFLMFSCLVWCQVHILEFSLLAVGPLHLESGGGCVTVPPGLSLRLPLPLPRHVTQASWVLGNRKLVRAAGLVKPVTGDRLAWV